MPTVDNRKIDRLVQSPDGEPRGLLARIGDLFPLDPMPDLVAGIAEPATPSRPWGLRNLQAPQPRAGKHEGGTNETTGNTDGDNPGEEMQSD